MSSSAHLHGPKDSHQQRSRFRGSGHPPHACKQRSWEEQLTEQRICQCRYGALTKIVASVISKCSREGAMIGAVAQRTQVTPRIFLVFSVVALSTAVPAITALATARPGRPCRLQRSPPAGLTASAGQRPAYGVSPGMRTAREQGTLSDYRVTRPLDGEHFRRGSEGGWNAYPTSKRLTVTRLTFGTAPRSRPELGTTTTGSRARAMSGPEPAPKSAQAKAEQTRFGRWRRPDLPREEA